MATIIQLRRDDTVNWAEADPVLAEGEMGWERNGTEITAYKIGDGVRKWSELPYGSNVSILQELGQNETAVISQKAITNELDDRITILVGFGTSTISAGVTKEGDIYYNTEIKVLRRCVNYNQESPNDSNYETISFKEDAIYSCNNKLYMYRGNRLSPILYDTLPFIIPLYNKRAFKDGYYDLSGSKPILNASSTTQSFSFGVSEGEHILYNGAKHGNLSRSYAITDINDNIIEVSSALNNLIDAVLPYDITIPTGGIKIYFNIEKSNTPQSVGDIYASSGVNNYSDWLNDTFVTLLDEKDLVTGYYPMAGETIADFVSASNSTKGCKISVTEGQSVILFGKAYGQNSRTYAITDANGVILQVANAIAITEINDIPTLITVPKNGTTLYINNSIYGPAVGVFQDNFKVMGGILPTMFSAFAGNGDISSFKLEQLTREIDCDWNTETTNNYSLCWIKSVLGENKLPFNVGYYFSEYPAKNGKLYYGNSLTGEVKEIVDFAKKNTGFDTETYIESRVVAVSPKHNTIMNSVFDRYPGFGLRIYEDGVFGEVNMAEPMQAWLYNTGIEFVYDETGKEYCLYGEYSHARKSTRRIFKAEYPYINPNNWRTVFEIPSAEGATDGILHIHDIQKDPFSSYIYCICGDTADESRWFYSADLGETWQLLVKDKPAGYLRAINFVFLENDIYWASDDLSHYLLHAKRGANGLIDVSTIEVLKNLPSMQATNSLAYIQSINCLFFYDRVYEDSTGKNKLKEYIYDIARDEIVILKEFEKVDTTAYGSWGNRGKCYNHLPNSAEPHLAMGIVDEYAPCTFNLIGNNKETYGSILYKIE